MILYGHSRLDRPNEKFMLGLCAITHPPTLIIVRKLVGYVDLKNILQNVLRCSKLFLSLYDKPIGYQFLSDRL